MRTCDVSESKADLVLLEEEGGPGQVHRQLHCVQAQGNESATWQPRSNISESNPTIHHLAGRLMIHNPG